MPTARQRRLKPTAVASNAATTDRAPTAATTGRADHRTETTKLPTTMLRKPKMLSAGLAPLFVLLLLIVVGCGQRRVETYCFRATPVDGWETTDSLVFPIDTVHQAGRYRLSIGVRTSAANPYPFQTLALSITTRLQGKKAQRDTALCSLTDKDGDVNGQGVSLYQYAFPVSELHLEKGQTGTITVQHLMRRNLLPGVANVGIRLDRIP